MSFNLNKLMTATVLLTASLAIAACAPAPNVDEAGQEASAPSESAPAPMNALPLPQTPGISKGAASTILAKYQHLDPSHIVPTALLEKAVVYFDANQSSFANKNYIVVLDFSKSSNTKRFFTINLKSGAVQSYYVAHGSGSDKNHDGIAETFSNSNGSNASSLGFYRTAETYDGKHGYSLRMDGLSATNSNVRARAIVIHGADYVKNAPQIQGRSWGCFAFPMEQRTAIIDMLKGGALIYAATK